MKNTVLNMKSMIILFITDKNKMKKFFTKQAKNLVNYKKIKVLIMLMIKLQKMTKKIVKFF